MTGEGAPTTAAGWHSTRLFPKFAGAPACRPSGIAARCDWVVLSDPAPPQVALIRQRAVPRHVFLSLRAPFRALAFFVEEVLPQIPGPFVLVSGSEDVTLPRQTDRRWRPFDAAERARTAAIPADPRLLRWFAENLDEAGHPRFAPLPVGLVWPEGPPEGAWPPGPVPPLGPRPLRVLCAQRLREGPQWEARRQAAALARGPWAGFVTLPGAELPEAEFLAACAGHSFVLCVEGGGLDPSPKAWTALLCGAIPIIRQSPVAVAYRALPVAVVPGWSARALDAARLAGWKAALLPEFDDPARRAAVLVRLRLDHWWAQIAAAGPGAHPGPRPGAG
jgi:hypothetical protein